MKARREALIASIKNHLISSRLTPELQEYFEKEKFFFQCNPSKWDELVKLKETLAGKKVKNVINSTIAYLIGVTDEKPTEACKRSPTALPDIDFDTDSRDRIKDYLKNKYGANRVSLLGTYQTLKSKGAIKDVCRRLRPELSDADKKALMDAGKPVPKTMTFEEVNIITKKFDLLKRTDFGNDPDSELKFFNATLDSDPWLKDWFDKNKDVKDAVSQILGNAKSTGIHAGGIVVAGKDIFNIIPLSYERSEQIWVTQPEMAFVELAGLIKYDFLGLKTLEDFNRCIQLIEKRHGKRYLLSDIPLDDQEVLTNFRLGKTESVFQFNTDLSVSLLTKLKSLDSVNDLALITSILRPGPLNMKMDETFVRRKNEIEPITYVHPKLRESLSETYGIVVYQEQVMQIVQILGGLTPAESLMVMKGMAKKQKEKLIKFESRFKEHASKAHGVKEDLAQGIWDLLASFAEYGFNKSHAIAYSCMSYICMWFKTKYPKEWMAAVLAGAEKDDFKILYQHWRDHIIKPHINYSKNTYFITDDGEISMPFSAINGVGEKAVDAIVLKQPYSSFEDFFARVDRRKVTKATFINLIFSGAFDCFIPADQTPNKFRKNLINQLFELRHKEKKPNKVELEQDTQFKNEIAIMTKTKFLIKELTVLNFTSFDYFDYFKNKVDDLKNGARENGQSLQIYQPSEVLEAAKANKGDKRKEFVVFGAVLEVERILIKKEGSKFKGKEMLKFKISNNGQPIDAVVFPNVVEAERERAKEKGKVSRYDKLTDYDPIFAWGTINYWNDQPSFIINSAIFLN